MVARLHPLMRGRGFGEGEDAIDDGLELAFLDMRPDGAGEFLGDETLERGIARAQRRAGQRQAAAHDVEDWDRRLQSALHRDRDMAAVFRKAFEVAREKSITTVGFTGEGGGKMKSISDYLIDIPSKDTPRIQESHIMLGHIICQLVEERFFASDGRK